MNYVRLTFVPAGGKPRSIWAKPGRADDKIALFWRVSREGEEPEPRELMVAAPTEFHTRPARMNLKYARLEIAP
jgi:hypothetical protein